MSTMIDPYHISSLAASSSSSSSSRYLQDDASAALGWQAYVVIAITILMVILLYFDIMPGNFAMCLCLALCIAAQTISASDALSGFSNDTVLSIASLYIVAAGMTSTGGLDHGFSRILGIPKSVTVGLIKLSLSCAAFSVFLNNTPIVAMLVPVVTQWCQKAKLPPSLFMIPLSWSVMLGGMCSLIGTSSNLAVAGKFQQVYGESMGIFGVGMVAFPALFSGLTYIVLFDQLLLPNAKALQRRFDKAQGNVEKEIPQSKSLDDEGIEKRYSEIQSQRSQQNGDVFASQASKAMTTDEMLEHIKNHDMEAKVLDIGEMMYCYVEATSTLCNQPVINAAARDVENISYIYLQRNDKVYNGIFDPNFIINEGDVLCYTGDREVFKKYCESNGLSEVNKGEKKLTKMKRRKFTFGETKQKISSIKVAIRKGNYIIGKKLDECDLGNEFHLHVFKVEQNSSTSSDKSMHTNEILQENDILHCYVDEDFNPNNDEFQAKFEILKQDIVKTVSETSTLTESSSPEEFIMCMKVIETSKLMLSRPLNGRTLEDSGIIYIPGTKLLAIERNGVLILSEPLKHLRKHLKSLNNISKSDIGKLLSDDDNNDEKRPEMETKDYDNMASGEFHVGDLDNDDSNKLTIDNGEDNPSKLIISPSFVLRANDLLWFSGGPSSLPKLRLIPGLEDKSVITEELSIPILKRRLIQVVISWRSDMVDKMVRDTNFRKRFKANIVAIKRGGVGMFTKIANIVLKPGDVLILDAGDDFAQLFRNDKNFLLISEIEKSTPPHFGKFFITLFALIAMMTAYTLASDYVPLVVCVVFASGIILGTYCLTTTAAQQSINWQIVVMVACAYGISNALEDTGVAAAIGNGLVKLNSLMGDTEAGLLSLLYLATFIITAFIANNAAALVMFPVGVAAIQGTSFSNYKMAYVIMLSAGSSYMTPFSYQTNLMVYGPGGYEFNDYLRMGTPLQVWQWIFTIIFVVLMDVWYYCLLASIVAFIISVIVMLRLENLPCVKNADVTCSCNCQCKCSNDCKKNDDSE